MLLPTNITRVLSCGTWFVLRFTTLPWWVLLKLLLSLSVLVSLATYCVDYPSSNGNVPINNFSSYNIGTLPPHAYDHPLQFFLLLFFMALPLRKNPQWFYFHLHPSSSPQKGPLILYVWVVYLTSYWQWQCRSKATIQPYKTWLTYGHMPCVGGNFPTSKFAHNILLPPHSGLAWLCVKSNRLVHSFGPFSIIYKLLVLILQRWNWGGSIQTFPLFQYHIS
jgi:hypothetical protein